MSTITYAGGSAITPQLVEIASTEARSRSRNVVHQPLDGPPVFTLRAATPSSGRLRLIFASEQDARDAYAVHQLASVFTITTHEIAGLSFRYIADGDIAIRLDETTASVWLVEVDYQVVDG